MKFLGAYISGDFTWSLNTQQLIKDNSQRSAISEKAERILQFVQKYSGTCHHHLSHSEARKLRCEGEEGTPACNVTCTADLWGNLPLSTGHLHHQSHQESPQHNLHAAFFRQALQECEITDYETAQAIRIMSIPVKLSLQLHNHIERHHLTLLYFYSYVSNLLTLFIYFTYVDPSAFFCLCEKNHTK